MSVIAAFDVDKTLTTRDCVVPFMAEVAGRRRLLATVVPSAVTMARWMMSGQRDAVKTHMVNQVFNGREVKPIRELGAVFANRVASRWMRSDTTSRLRWHQAQGHIVVLVSASLDAYVEPLGDMLEVDAVLCSRLGETGGIYDGTLVEGNCRGAEKARRLLEWRASAGLDQVPFGWAYGDSTGDVELLELAANAEWVGKRDVKPMPV